MNRHIPDLYRYFEDHKYNIDQSIEGTEWLLRRFRETRKKIYLEIGAASLYTFGIYESELPPKEEGGLAIGIDIHPNRDDWHTYKSFSGCDTLLIEGSSIDPATVGKVKDKLAGRPIDWLFIDGNHYTQFVRKEWELYSPLVRKNGGIVVFHDCDPPAGLKVYQMGDDNLDKSGQGAGVMFHHLLNNGYNIRMVPVGTIGTSIVEL